MLPANCLSPGAAGGEEAYGELLDYLSGRNAAAALALQSRKDALQAFHRLDVPSIPDITFRAPT
jgi:hypothetical protein